MLLSAFQEYPRRGAVWAVPHEGRDGSTSFWEVTSLSKVTIPQERDSRDTRPASPSTLDTQQSSQVLSILVFIAPQSGKVDARRGDVCMSQP